MFAPMFLLPNRQRGSGSSIPDSFLTVNYYLDGQSIGGLTYDISADKGKQIIVRPRCCHFGSTRGLLGPAPIETGSASHPLTHPIPGFDGWIGAADQPYGELILPASKYWNDNTLPAPLNGPKGSYALNRINASNGNVKAGIEIEVDGTVKGSVMTYFRGPDQGSFGAGTNTGYPESSNILTWQQTNITGQYVTLTVEFT